MNRSVGNLACPPERPAIVTQGRLLLVDLNNEAPYPTMTIGCLVAALKQGGYEADVFSPLVHGIKPLARDLQETFSDYAVARIVFSGNRVLHWANELIYDTYHRIRFRATQQAAGSL